MKRLITVLLCAMGLLLSGFSVLAESSEEALAYVEGEAIVCIQTPASREALPGLLAGGELLMQVSDTRNISAYGGENSQELMLIKQDGMSTEQLIEELEGYPEVLFAEPNYEYSLDDEVETGSPLSVSDVFVETEYKDMTEYQWAYNNIGQQSGVINTDMDIPGWNQTSDSEESLNGGGIDLDGELPVVAVVDTGINYKHPELSGKMWHRSDNAAWANLPGGEYGYSPYENGAADVMDAHSHGTHCAGIIGAQWNEFGTSGAGEKIKLMAVKVLNDAGSGSTATILKGISYVKQACEAGVNIKAANFSLGGPILSEAQNLALLELGESGVISCVASGNDGKNLDNYGSSGSSSFDNPYVIHVNAMKSDGTRAEFSNYSDVLTDVYAPGAGILSSVTLSDMAYYAELDTAPLMYQNFEEEEAPFTFTKLDGTVLGVEEGDAFDGTHSISVQVGDDQEGIISSPISLDVPEGKTCYISAHVYADNNATAIGKFFVKGKDGGWIPASSENYDGIAYGMMWGTVVSSLPAETDFENFQLKLIFAQLSEGSVQISVDCIGVGCQLVPYQYYNGTSMATPAVTAEAALLASWIPEAPDKTIARIIGSVKRTDALAETCTSGGYISFDQVFSPYPVIQSVRQEGNSVILSGHFFEDTAGSAKIDGRSVPVLYWKETEIKLQLPKGAESGLKKIELTTASGGTGYTYKKTEANYYQGLDVPDDRLFKSMLNTAVVALKDKLYYVGELESEQSGSKIWQYDLASGQWGQLEGFPAEAKSVFAACAWEEKLVIAMSGEKTTLLTYNPDSGEWTSDEYAEIPNSSSLVNCQGKLYSIGGVNNQTGMGNTDIIQLNPYVKTAEKVGSLQNGRMTPGVAAVGNQIVIIGGYTVLGGGLNPITSTEIFNGEICSEVSGAFPPYTDGDDMFLAVGALKNGVIAAGTNNPSSISDTSVLSLEQLSAGFVDQQIRIISSKVFTPTGAAYKGKFYVIGDDPLSDKKKIFACTDVETAEQEVGDVSHGELYPASIRYMGHVQDIGWQDTVSDGMISGTEGRGLRLEAFRIFSDSFPLSGDVIYSAHVQNIGWQNSVKNGELSGTEGKGMRMEAVRIQLSGEMAEQYHIQYRVHVQNIGWMDWVQDGETAGTTGLSLRAEALEIRFVKK